VGLFVSVATQRERYVGANRWITKFGLVAVLAIACPCQVAQKTRTRQGSPPFQRKTWAERRRTQGPRSGGVSPFGLSVTGPSRTSFGQNERKALFRRVQGISWFLGFALLDLAPRSPDTTRYWGGVRRLRVPLQAFRPPCAGPPTSGARRKPAGQSQSIGIPTRPWESLSSPPAWPHLIGDGVGPGHRF
jgi:hypothetical protein